MYLELNSLFTLSERENFGRVHEWNRSLSDGVESGEEVNEADISAQLSRRHYQINLQSDQTSSENLLLFRQEEHHTGCKKSPSHVGESGEQE
jgi:hypothetical protein